LCDLCNKTEEELTDILENSKTAKQVYEFLSKTNKTSNQEDEVDFEDLNDFYQEPKKQKLDNKQTEPQKKSILKTSSNNNQRKKKNK
jgi:hypothetical protein